MVQVRQQIKESVLELSTTKVRVIEAGQGEPTIFLHQVGVANGAETWLPLIALGLADSMRVIAIDNLGWGPVERPLINYSFPYWVDHVREVQDALGLAKTNIVGHSLGGWIGAVFAYESPERVNKLALVANAGMNPDPPAGVVNFSLPTRESIASNIKLEDREVGEVLLEERWRNVVAEGAEESFKRISEHLQDYDMRRRYNLRRRLPRIQAPTLVVYGENDRGYPPDPMGKEIVSLLPNSEFVVLPETGHNVPLERPRELTQLLRDFLKS